LVDPHTGWPSIAPVKLRRLRIFRRAAVSFSRELGVG
jgi:hypothetical protein